MRYSIIFFLLLFTLSSLKSQDSLLIPTEKDNYQFWLGGRPGFNIGGVGSHLKDEMSLIGMSGNGLFGTNYPRASFSGSFLVEIEYRKKPIGVGLEFGLSEEGYAKGLTATTIDTFIIWETKDRHFMTLNHRVNTISPYFRYYNNRVGFQIGLSFNSWEINREENSYSTKGNTVGGNAGLILALIDNNKFRMELTSIYRYVGRKTIGPITKAYSKEKAFPNKEISLNHFQIGLSICFNLHP